MLKYVSKFVLDILPSVVATIVGAYIVTNYINSKPAADAPKAAATSTANPASVDAKAPDPAPEIAVKSPTNKPYAVPSEAAKAAESGPAKGKIAAEKAAVDKPATEKSADGPVEARRHQPIFRDKSVAKPAPSAPSATTTASVPVEAGPNTDERRDANELARAAIERLRGPVDASRPVDTAAPVNAAAPVAPKASVMQPLPPPVTVAMPAAEPVHPPQTQAERAADPSRPTPPGNIPSRPLDLQAAAGVPATAGHTSVADDVFSAARSVFQAVLPR